MNSLLSSAIKKNLKLFIYTLLLISLASCTKTSTYEIKTDQIEVGSTVTGCELIKVWDGIEIKNEFISEHGDFITLPSNKKINCSLIDTSTLVVLTTTFDYQKKKYTSNIEIIDTTAPELIVENE
ncbi:MAG: hypothetical protein RR531_12400, partial [Longicatena sp.]